MYYGGLPLECCVAVTWTGLWASDARKKHIEIHCERKSLIIDDFRELRVYTIKSTVWKDS
jgi:hypothetical protein